jgi:hypothetical protein
LFEPATQTGGELGAEGASHATRLLQKLSKTMSFYVPSSQRRIALGRIFRPAHHLDARHHSHQGFRGCWHYGRSCGRPLVCLCPLRDSRQSRGPHGGLGFRSGTHRFGRRVPMHCVKGSGEACAMDGSITCRSWVNGNSIRQPRTRCGISMRCDRTRASSSGFWWCRTHPLKKQAEER